MKYALSLTFLIFSFALFAQDEEGLDIQAPITNLEFAENAFDFGEIVQGEKVSQVFKFKNTGTVPLIITSAEGSCGCTIPYYPVMPILPGEESEIEVEFDSKGKLGMQTKRVTIFANTSPEVSILTITGKVLPREDTEMYEKLNEQKEEDRASMESINSDCIALFPNPTSETLQLELKESIGKSANVEIHDRAGKLILKRKIERITRETTKFDVTSYDEGIYIISIYIEGENKYLTQCFVVSRNRY